MSYTQHIETLFASNYALSFPVKYKGVGLIDPSTGNILNDQTYSEGPWLEIYTNGGPTIYGTIGSLTTRQANKPFTFVATIYWPITKSTSATQYNRSDADVIAEHLDTFMLTDGIVIDSKTMYYSNQSQPKQEFAPQPDPDDNFERLTVEYLYTYNYYPNA